jgi:hypothetical protein
LKLDDKNNMPKATIADVAWLQGHWVGKGLGGTVEKFWSPPRGKSMMEAFRLIQNDAVVMQELCTMVEENGSLVYRVKHFDAKLKAWEEKDVSVNFPLVKLAPRAAYFDGLTLVNKDDGSLVTYLVTRNRKTGETREQEINSYPAPMQEKAQVVPEPRRNGPR